MKRRRREERGGSERAKDETGGERTEWLKEGRAWMERWRERGTQSNERSDRGRERKKKRGIF